MLDSPLPMDRRKEISAKEKIKQYKAIKQETWFKWILKWKIESK